MADPISHAEMIAAVTRRIEYLTPKRHSDDPRYVHAAELAAMRAVLAHLERAQPTDTQADLTERARGGLIGAWLDQFDITEDALPSGALDDLETRVLHALRVHRAAARKDAELARDEALARAQSEREAAAAEARRVALRCVTKGFEWHRRCNALTANKALIAVSEMLYQRPDMVAAIRSLMEPSEHAVFDEAAAALHAALDAEAAAETAPSLK